MPIDDLTALGQKMREARKNKELTQQELSDLSHVSVKQIANIEKGKMNPSYLILRALAKVLHISLDTLINPDVSLEDEGVNQMKMLYSSCPPEMRDTLLHHTQETVKELTELCTCCAVYSIVNVLNEGGKLVLLINTDKKGKKQAHQMKLYQKYFPSCFKPRRILSRTRLGSTPSTSAISFTVIPR